MGKSSSRVTVVVTPDGLDGRVRVYRLPSGRLVLDAPYHRDLAPAMRNLRAHRVRLVVPDGQPCRHGQVLCATCDGLISVEGELPTGEQVGHARWTAAGKARIDRRSLPGRFAWSVAAGREGDLRSLVSRVYPANAASHQRRRGTQQVTGDEPPIDHAELPDLPPRHRRNLRPATCRDCGAPVSAQRGTLHQVCPASYGSRAVWAVNCATCAWAAEYGLPLDGSRATARAVAQWRTLPWPLMTIRRAIAYGLTTDEAAAQGQQGVEVLVALAETVA